MLRDFITSQDNFEIDQFLSYFKFESSKNYEELGYVNYILLGFRILTPDSFIWELLIDNEIYYLYAEDYVTSLEQIIIAVKKYDRSDIKLDFIEVLESKGLKESDQITSSDVDETPENSDELQKYAQESGYDLAFLLKTDKDASDAYFYR